MQNFSTRYPGLSPILVLASLIGIPFGNMLFQLSGNAGTRIGLLVSLAIALTGLLLGVAGYFGTRGERLTRRLPLAVGALLGAILVILYAFVFFLHVTPNAPF